ncbi:hypothetical protein BOX15_Mlig027948g1, partial [Macrostomum lignano]
GQLLPWRQLPRLYRMVARQFGSHTLVARSFMYVPASSEKMLSKLASRRPLPDLPVLDLEDGVAFAAKAAAREGARRALTELRLPELLGGGRSVAVRVNPPAEAEQLAEEDVRCVMDSARPPDVLVLPKVESADDVAWLSGQLERHWRRPPSGPNSAVPLILMIESAAALLAMPQILDSAMSASRQRGLLHPVGCVFGSDDFCASVGVERSRDGLETRHARAQFALAARSRRLLAIDMVEIDIKDVEHLKRQCNEGRAMGFTGKQIIHPSQLEPCHAAFSPVTSRVAWAERLCEEFERHSSAGAGAFVFDGQMIDMPTVRQAQSLLAQHRALLALDEAALGGGAGGGKPA